MLPLDKRAALRRIVGMTRTISDAGLQLIASFEGFSPTLYNDPSGNCTIGYGFLVHLGKCDGSPSEAPWRQGITEAQGRALLADKVQSYADAVARTTRTDLTEHQFDALVSLCYNIGPGGYLNSSVRTAVNARGDVCAELRKYVYGSDGIAYAGLIRRRNAECALYNTPDNPEDEPMTKDELARLENVERQVYGARVDLNALANAQDAVTQHNDVQDQAPKLSLKGLWYIAGKAWPF